jgi:hypothetical protein
MVAISVIVGLRAAAINVGDQFRPRRKAPRPVLLTAMTGASRVVEGVDVCGQATLRFPLWSVASACDVRPAWAERRLG